MSSKLSCLKYTVEKFGNHSMNQTRPYFRCGEPAIYPAISSMKLQLALHMSATRCTQLNIS